MKCSPDTGVTDLLPYVTGRINSIIFDVCGNTPMPHDNLSALCHGALDIYDIASLVKQFLDVAIDYNTLHRFVTVGDLHQWVSDAVREREHT